MHPSLSQALIEQFTVERRAHPAPRPARRRWFARRASSDRRTSDRLAIP
jgi:hypothetical protein